MSDLGGVWRTVGGRRIFIKDGEDLATAMTKSGKFENLKKRNVDKLAHEFVVEYNNKELAKEAVKEYDDLKKKKEEGNKDLVEKIKNFDASKVSKDKWSAEEEFLARMSNYYKDKDSTLSESQKTERLKGVEVIAKNQDYLLYSTKDVTEKGGGYTNYEIATSHDNSSRFDRPPDVYIRRDWQSGKIEGVEINWAAYGSVDVSKTEEFIGKLQNAVKFSKDVEKKLKGKKY